MAICLADIVADDIDSLKQQLTELTARMNKLVSSCEQTIPKESVLAAQALNLMSIKLGQLMDEMLKYGLFDSSLYAYLDTLCDEEEALGRRFKRWASQELLTVKAVAALYERSKSTIYRWIKSGKLKAEKVGRNWLIAV